MAHALAHVFYGKVGGEQLVGVDWRNVLKQRRGSYFEIWDGIGYLDWNENDIFAHRPKNFTIIFTVLLRLIWVGVQLYVFSVYLRVKFADQHFFVDLAGLHFADCLRKGEPFGVQFIFTRYFGLIEQNYLLFGELLYHYWFLLDLNHRRWRLEAQFFWRL